MKLSKQERRILTEPCVIARENKIYKHKIIRADSTYCLMHGQQLEKLVKKLSSIYLLSEKLKLTIADPLK